MQELAQNRPDPYPTDGLTGALEKGGEIFPLKTLQVAKLEVLMPLFLSEWRQRVLFRRR